MKAPYWLLAGAVILTTGHFSSPVRAETAPPDQVLKNESEAGIVINKGNADSQSYNLKQTSSYDFSENQFKLTGHFLETKAGDTTSAHNWDVGLRYERYLFSGISGYLGQNVEADTFAGYTQRYNSDVGAKYSIWKTEDYYWNAGSLMPPIGMLLGKVDFTGLFIALDDESYPSLAEAKKAGAPTINYGMFFNTLIDFVIVAFCIFLVVRLINRIMRAEPTLPPPPNTRDCPQCLMNIPIAAKKCGHCTSAVV